jgi:hypothetical protein
MKNLLHITLLMTVVATGLRAEDNEFLGKVKSLAAQTAGAAAGSAATSLNKVAQATPATGPDADIQNAISALKAQVEASMAAFQKSSMPDEEKMKMFDKSLGLFDEVLAQTQEGGALDALIQKSYTQNKKGLDMMKAKANDTSVPADNRAAYVSKIGYFESQINQTNEKRLVMLRARNELLKRRDLITQNKQFYLDMLSINDVEEANKSLDAVISSQMNLADVIDKMGSSIANPTQSGPAKR